MKTSNEIREQRGAILDKMKKIVETAETEKRNLSEEEKKKWDELQAEYDSMTKDIERREKYEEMEAARATEKKPFLGKAGGEKREKTEISRRYSIVKAIRSQVGINNKLEGVELEMHEEGVKEARQSGLNVLGVAMPSFMVDMEKRDLTVGNPDSAGNLVATELDSNLIGVLRPKLMFQSMGAMVMPGLVGNLEFPKQTKSATANWVGEKDPTPESTPEFKLLEMKPKRLSGKTIVSRQNLIQTSMGLENLIRRDLTFAINQAIDTACLIGEGTNNQPFGILNEAGIGSVGGATATAPTRTHIVALENEIAINDADFGTLGFLTTPGVRSKLKLTKTDAGSGNFVWEQNERTLLSYRAEVSTQVPNNLSDGTRNDLHAILFGDFSQFVIGNWAGIDMTIDEITMADTAQIKVLVHSWWDTMVRYAEAFAAMKVADATL